MGYGPCRGIARMTPDYGVVFDHNAELFVVGILAVMALVLNWIYMAKGR